MAFSQKKKNALNMSAEYMQYSLLKIDLLICYQKHLGFDKN